jgi:hypothetical protein
MLLSLDSPHFRYFKRPDAFCGSKISNPNDNKGYFLEDASSISDALGGI